MTRFQQNIQAYIDHSKALGHTKIVELAERVLQEDILRPREIPRRWASAEELVEIEKSFMGERAKCL